MRLNRLRKVKPKSRLELLGWIPVPYGQAAKREFEGNFASLRYEGDWYRPGIKLVQYIRDNACAHFCDNSCPDGTSIHEERQRLVDEANAVMAAMRF